MEPETKSLGWQQLANEIGCSRVTLTEWRKRPDAPQSRDVTEWKVYVATNDLGTGGGSLLPANSRELKDEKTRHEIELLKAKLDREKRLVIPTAEVTKLLLTVATQQRTKLYQFFETELPPRLDGMSAVQMRPILKEAADSISDVMSEEVERFNGHQ